MTNNERFWALVFEHEIRPWHLSQICSAPIKVLLCWFDDQPPDSAIADLEKHLGIRHDG